MFSTWNSTFKDFLVNAERHWGENELYLELNKTTGNLVCKYPGTVESKNIAESIGVAGGLSVFGHLYNLHQADWKRIGIQTTKDLDFTRTSTISDRTLNVELKGSILDDNSKKSGPIYAHKASIADKKEEISTNRIYASADTCLSTIVAVSKKLDQHVKCWILDPPSETNNSEPSKNRLLSRLYYYGEILNWISPRSQLSTALINRIRAIEKSSAYQELNKLVLVKGDQDKIQINETFVTTRSHVLTNRFGIRPHHDLICGSTGVSKEGQLWFLGLPITAISMLRDQDFDLIDGYKKSSSTFPGILQGILKTEDFKRSNKRLGNLFNVRENINSREMRFHVDMQFVMCSSGLVFGRVGERHAPA